MKVIGLVMVFKDTIVVITGSESGIGNAAAELMIKNGAFIIGMDLKQKNGLRFEIGQYEFIQVDVSDAEKIKNVFDEIVAKYDKIDVLLNCAGITSLDSVMDVSSKSWDTMLDVNLKSVFFCCQNVLKTMTKQGYGKIVNISSNAGIGGGKAVGAHYSASKAGVVNLTKSLALYAADYNINVNCVAPGPTETPMTSEWSSILNEKLKKVIPFKRFAEPVEIAEAILFLASDKSNYITGETLNVNGGLLMD